MEVHGHAGAALTLIARDELGHVAQAASTMPLARAEKQPLTTEKLREQLGRLGGTPFHLGELKNMVEGELMLPVSELNRLRRILVTKLEARRAEPKRWTQSAGSSPMTAKLPSTGNSASAELIVLVRSLAQLDAALRSGVRTIYCELEDPKKYREAVGRVRLRSDRSREGRTV